ncbi:MAG TPA: hypothetical protein ENJ60_08985 [Aeromonadales bacterium]|nr:hypothetical protein [Aeromonadales bacterium]
MKNIFQIVVLLAFTFFSMPAEAAEDIQQVINQASEKCNEAEKLGFEWAYTREMIISAQKALDAKQVKIAGPMATRALHQALNAIKQAKYADEHWQDFLP